MFGYNILIYLKIREFIEYQNVDLGLNTMAYENALAYCIQFI